MPLWTTLERNETLKLITFFCNANISSLILDWYINGEAIATYTYRDGQSFPRTLSPVIAGVEVQISSAASENGFINFENFTLAVPLCIITTFGEATVQCGNSLIKSNTVTFGLANWTGNDLITKQKQNLYSNKCSLLINIFP